VCLGRVGVVSSDYDFVLLIPHQHIALLDVKQGSRLDRDDILISIGSEQQQLALLALLVKNDNVLHIKGVGFAKAKAAITMQQELDLNGGSIGELLENFRSSRPHRMAVTNSILACLGNFGWSVVQAMQLDDSDDESYISVMD
jgi:5'-3' exonuclease